MSFRFNLAKASLALFSCVTFSVIASERISIRESGGQFSRTSFHLSVANGNVGTTQSDIEASNRILFQNGFDLFVKNKDATIPYIRINRTAADPTRGISVFDHFSPSISANGKVVAFSNSRGNNSAFSGSSTFVPTEIANGGKAFIRDLETDELVQIVGSSILGKPALSKNGECVVFSNAVEKEIQVARISQLADLNNASTIDIIASIPTGNFDSNRRYFGISGNCSEVFYRTDQVKDPSKDIFGTSDIYAHNINTGKDELITTDSQGVRLNNEAPSGTLNSFLLAYPSFTEFGNLVAFERVAINAATGDAVKKVYAKNRLTGELRDLSVSNNGFAGECEGVFAASCNANPQISPNGEYVAFYTRALSNSDIDPNGDVSTAYTAVIYQLVTSDVIRSDYLVSAITSIGAVESDELAINNDGVYYSTDAAIDAQDTNLRVDLYFDQNPFLISL